MATLTGKTFLVTHAHQKVGLESAKAILRAGGRVLAHYEPLLADGQTIAKAIGIRPSETIAADLHIPEHPIGLWNAALDRAHRIDGLVNVSGIYKPSFMNGGDLAWMESWRMAIQVNLTAAADLCRAAEPHFRANGGGVIVVVSAPSAEETGGALDAACVASRGGLIALSRTLSRAFSDQGIAMYCIAPNEADPTLPFEQRGGLHDWVRTTPYPGVNGDAAIGELVTKMLTEATPAYARVWDDANLVRPLEASAH